MSKFEEVWADIAGYDGLYRVSNAGRVLSLRIAYQWTLTNPYED